VLCVESPSLVNFLVGSCASAELPAPHLKSYGHLSPLSMCPDHESNEHLYTRIVIQNSQLIPDSNIQFRVVMGLRAPNQLRGLDESCW
jgi:hypothetical protein